MQFPLNVELLRTAVESAYNAIMITTAEIEEPGPMIVYVNPALCRMTGYSAEEIIGRNPRMFQGLETERVVLDRLRADLAAGRHFEGSTVNYRKDGTPYVVEWSISPVRDDSGRVSHFVTVQHDITGRRKLEAELQSMAMRDHLTGLYNRRVFDNFVGAEITRTTRYGSRFCVVMVDVDDFKSVNDRLGHAAGDETLARIAAEIARGIRGSDVPFRWGGEEFLVLLPETDLVGARTVAESLRERVAGTMLPAIGRMTVSAGVASFEAGEALQDMLHRADEALYEAKRAGRNRVCVAAQ